MVFRTRSLIVAAVLLALCTSCGRGPNLRPIPITEQDQVFYSDQSQWREEAGVAIKDADTWAEYWERVTGSLVDLPSIDFEREMLLLVPDGQGGERDRVRRGAGGFFSCGGDRMGD